MRALQIVKPCTESWEAMAADGPRRFCESCRKHIVDLSTLTSAQATVLLEAAPHGSVCVRASHDDDGAIVFARANQDVRASGWRLALGASLFVAACTPSGGPPPAQGSPDAPPPGAPIASSQAADAQERDRASAVAPAKCIPLGTAQPASTVARANGPAPLRRPRVTMGCACVAGDPLCSCL